MALSNKIGTLKWAKETGGALSPTDQNMIREQVAAMQAGVSQEIAPSLVTTEGLARVDLNKVRTPDSRTARHAETLVAEFSHPALTHHCYRTYFWGRLLAQHDAVEVQDEEAFYVASLLHDLGLTEQHFCRRQGVHCFAVEGAYAAADFLAQEGWEQTRRDVVAEAISLHLNMLVELSRGPLAHYLSAGAKCDVVGARVEALPQSTLKEVLRRYPGQDFANVFASALGAEAQARPQSRICFSITNFPPPPLFPVGKISLTD